MYLGLKQDISHIPGQGIKRPEDPCISCSGCSNIPRQAEKLSVLSQCEAEDWPEKAGMWGWHCMAATGQPGWQARWDRDGLWGMWSPGIWSCNGQAVQRSLLHHRHHSMDAGIMHWEGDWSPMFAMWSGISDKSPSYTSSFQKLWVIQPRNLMTLVGFAIL